VNGKLVYEDGELIGDSPAMALVYER